MGLHGSAITIGIAIGAPLAGAVIDASVPAWGFAATGLISALVALAVLTTELRRRRTRPTPSIPGGATPIDGGASPETAELARATR
jgi:predicted MFS family arabinose efflux permease